MRLLLLEIYCDCDNEKEEPIYCFYGKNNPGQHCFQNMCKYLSYANCPNEFAYAGENGLVEDKNSSIGLGGDMLPNNVTTEELNKYKKIWKEICIEKINDAYKKYLHETELADETYN